MTRSFSSLSQEYAEGNILVDIYFLTGYDSAQWAAKQRESGKESSQYEHFERRALNTWIWRSGDL